MMLCIVPRLRRILQYGQKYLIGLLRQICRINKIMIHVYSLKGLTLLR
eukprot:XP_001704467.1 Hypothetical protein GL50803_36474 [Giardia lamblia ATCC 50803]